MQDIIYIKSILNVDIKVLKIGWMYICQKHEDLKENFNRFKKCLEDSDEIWISKQDPTAHMHYKRINKKYICAVCKHYNGDGFLITAYLTYKLQGKKKIWSK